jgi:hypothetical protein
MGGQLATKENEISEGWGYGGRERVVVEIEAQVRC